MEKANFKQQMIDIAKKFKWYEVLYLTLGLIAVVALSIIAKSSAITILYSIFGVLYVGAIAKQLKIGLIFGLLQTTLYIVQSALYNNWGEFILNIAIVLPLIVLSIVGWFRKSSGVTVTSKKLSRNEWIILTIINLAVSIAFYFVLAEFDTPNLLLASISAFFTILAHYLMVRKSPFMFVGFIGVNITTFLIWLLPIIEVQALNFETVPMLATIVVYLISNIFGAINWFKDASKKQKEQESQTENLTDMQDK